MSVSPTEFPWIMKVIWPNGVEIETGLKREPDLDTLRAAMNNGYIELLPHFDRIEIDNRIYNRGVIAYVDEDGRSRGLPFNRKATIAWLQCLGDDAQFLFPPVVLGPLVVIVKTENNNGRHKHE